ncbi:MAG TPA: SRPBCC family protein [Candidatus Chromulinivoraceae bacterium]|nr:SRPBCC family protein [Candidatus Chromulinivoraceae bacterium]
MNITSDAFIEIDAPSSEVWQAITDPIIVKKWFFGTNVESDWKVGSPIMFRGEWEGKAYEDKGIIQKIEVNKLLSYTHFSSRTGQADVPENYELVQFILSGREGGTTVAIHEENLPSVEARDKSLGVWSMILTNLKKVVEG